MYKDTYQSYGGIYESDDVRVFGSNKQREYTLDDFYTIDLSKMNKVVCLKECPIDKVGCISYMQLEWNESEDEEDDEDDDSDDSEEGEEELEPEGVEDVPMAEEAVEDPLEEVAQLHIDDEMMLSPEDQARMDQMLALRREATAFMGVCKGTNRTEEDILSTPEPGEVLKTFYTRTKHYWAAKAYEMGQGESRGKQLRRDGFDVSGTCIHASSQKSDSMNTNLFLMRYAS